MTTKSLLVILLIISALSVALFGFTMMEHVTGHEAGGCVASLGRVAPCPEAAGSIPTDFIAFHLEVLKVFSAAPDFVKVMTALLFLLVLVVLGRLKFFWRDKVPSVNYSTMVRYADHESITPLEINLRQWLALHEKRDPIAALRVHWSS